ncbi:hypothetical protein CY35_02G063500 [Sphagnum magellanicum]|nr:hypothetical protein CY35_02G063500 [Sphagnum magellanicum]
MSDSDEDIQLPNYREILSGATSYHDAVNRVKPHLHSTLKLPAKNPLQPEAKATPRDFHHRGESDDHRNDFLDEEDSIYGNSTQQQQLPQAQGKPVDLPMSGFKSRAVYCEVKLAEMLGKGIWNRATTLGDHEDKPNAYRTSVCCLVPYFDLVAKLEEKYEGLLEEQKKWNMMLQERQVVIDRIENHIQDLKEEISKEKSHTRDLQGDLFTMQKTLRKSNKEGKELKKKLEESRKDVMRAHELAERHDNDVNKYMNLEARYADLTHEVQHIQANLTAARQEASDGVPKDEFDKAKKKILDLESKLMQTARVDRQSHNLTPRPQWSELRGSARYTSSTATQAAEVCMKNEELQQTISSLRSELAYAEVALAEVRQHIQPPNKAKAGKKKGRKPHKK